jgi:hypothetical protein
VQGVREPIDSAEESLNKPQQHHQLGRIRDIAIIQAQTKPHPYHHQHVLSLAANSGVDPNFQLRLPARHRDA